MASSYLRRCLLTDTLIMNTTCALKEFRKHRSCIHVDQRKSLRVPWNWDLLPIGYFREIIWNQRALFGDLPYLYELRAFLRINASIKPQLQRKNVIIKEKIIIFQLIPRHVSESILPPFAFAVNYVHPLCQLRSHADQFGYHH